MENTGWEGVKTSVEPVAGGLVSVGAGEKIEVAEGRGREKQKGTKKRERD